MDVQEAKSLADAGKCRGHREGRSVHAGRPVPADCARSSFRNWVIDASKPDRLPADAEAKRSASPCGSRFWRRPRIRSRRRSTARLSESSVQQRRADTDAELLVQLPGVDDPARVKQILQTAAVLELYEVKGGPFPSREEALAQNGGVLPVGTKLVHQP